MCFSFIFLSNFSDIDDEKCQHQKKFLEKSIRQKKSILTNHKIHIVGFVVVDTHIIVAFIHIVGRLHHIIFVVEQLFWLLVGGSDRCKLHCKLFRIGCFRIKSTKGQNKLK